MYPMEVWEFQANGDGPIGPGETGVVRYGVERAARQGSLRPAEFVLSQAEAGSFSFAQTSCGGVSAGVRARRA